MSNKNEVKLTQEISPENADAQIELFKDYYEIDFSDFEDEAALKAIKSSINRLKRAICKGRVEIKEDGGIITVTQKFKKAVEDQSFIVYGEIKGSCKIRLKERDEKDNYGKIYSLLGGLCGEPDSFIQNFTGVDMSTAEVIGTLFLAV